MGLKNLGTSSETCFLQEFGGDLSVVHLQKYLGLLDKQIPLVWAPQ
jgi:hypothetical protein